MALLDLVDRFGAQDGRLPFPLTQQELASMAGVSRETCARALRHLEQRGIVATRYRAVAVPDVAGLRRVAAPG